MAEAIQHVVVRGAREHNLKGVDLEIPRDSLVTFTGVSGSGKSSLAYHTIYQEGQRRFLESLSSYARQFLGRMEKPKVDHVEGLSPTVSIDQKSVGQKEQDQLHRHGYPHTAIGALDGSAIQGYGGRDPLDTLVRHNRERIHVYADDSSPRRRSIST